MLSFLGTGTMLSSFLNSQCLFCPLHMKCICICWKNEWVSNRKKAEWGKEEKGRKSKWLGKEEVRGEERKCKEKNNYSERER